MLYKSTLPLPLPLLYGGVRTSPRDNNPQIETLSGACFRGVGLGLEFDGCCIRGGGSCQGCIRDYFLDCNFLETSWMEELVLGRFSMR